MGVRGRVGTFVPGVGHDCRVSPRVPELPVPVLAPTMSRRAKSGGLFPGWFPSEIPDTNDPTTESDPGDEEDQDETDEAPTEEPDDDPVDDVPDEPPAVKRYRLKKLGGRLTKLLGKRRTS